MPTGIGFAVPSLHSRGRRAFGKFAKTVKYDEFAIRMFHCLLKRECDRKMRRARPERHCQEFKFPAGDHGCHAACDLRFPFRLSGNEEGCDRAGWPVTGIPCPSPGKPRPAGPSYFHALVRGRSEISFEGQRFLAATPAPHRPSYRHLTGCKPGLQRRLAKSASG